MRAFSDLTLPRRLLCAVGLAPQGQAPDSLTLAEVAGSSPASVNTALTHLAEDGLIEGLWSGERWTNLTLTPRGELRAGFSPALDGGGSDGLSPLGSSVTAARARIQPLATAAAAEIAAELRAIPPTLERLREEAAPRAAALRMRAAETYRLFTSFP